MSNSSAGVHVSVSNEERKTDQTPPNDRLFLLAVPLGQERP